MRQSIVNGKRESNLMMPTTILGLFVWFVSKIIHALDGLQMSISDVQSYVKYSSYYLCSTVTGIIQFAFAFFHFEQFGSHQWHFRNDFV